jgi:hypothetical protein
MKERGGGEDEQQAKRRGIAGSQVKADRMAQCRRGEVVQVGSEQRGKVLRVVG